MHWITEFYQETKKASEKQLKLWVGYMKLFKDGDTVEKRKREKYIEIIYKEYKIRGIRQERSRERGKANKKTV